MDQLQKQLNSDKTKDIKMDSMMEIMMMLIESHSVTMMDSMSGMHSEALMPAQKAPSMEHH
jgi:hypothetical protein